MRTRPARPPESDLQFNLHGALRVMSDVASDIEAIEGETGASGPRVISTQVNVPARTIAFGLGTPGDLRTAHQRLGIEASDLFGNVSRPLVRGFVHRNGWSIEVFGPSGLTVIR